MAFHSTPSPAGPPPAAPKSVRITSRPLVKLVAYLLRTSVQRVFLGSFTIFGQQSREGPKAQPSFSSRTMPNPPDAVSKIGDWAVTLFGFAIPAYGGFVLAGYWVTHL
jgi:hypothetical protein